jgi:hypothetical protein
MNLVQIQERLKDAPMQAIMQYANGQNPMVPPYLALAELKRRESVNQSAQAQQAMQQGQKPSVKEQIEQSAGLAALQQQMQQRGLQQLANQAQPQGIPENVPQPERQPEPEGIANLPMRNQMGFAEGGIIPFVGGGGVQGFGGGETELKSNEQLRKELKQALDLDDYQQASHIARLMKMREAESPRTVKVPPAMMGDDVKPDQTPSPLTKPSPSVQSPTPQGVPERALPPPASRPQGGLPPPGAGAGGINLPPRMPGQMPSPDMAPPQAQPRGLPAVAGAGRAQEIMQGAMKEPMTPEQAMEQQQKMLSLAGLTDQYGDERMKRIQEMQAERQRQLEGRGMERLMRVLGGMGTGGLGGAGTAYLEAKEGERKADTEFQKQMDELMSGVEEKRRAERVAKLKGATDIMGESKKTQLGVAEKVFDAATREKLQELQLKAMTGKLSPEDEYVRQEIAKGRPYPKILEELNAIKTASREDISEQGRRRQYIEQWNKLLSDPLAKEEYRKLGIDSLEKYLRYVGASDAGAASSISVPQGAIDKLKQNPNLRAQFDEWYGAGSAAKYLGK